MKIKIGLQSLFALALAGCGSTEEQIIQPLSGTARVEVGQPQTQNMGSTATVQGLTPKLPPTGPDGGPL